MNKNEEETGGEVVRDEDGKILYWYCDWGKVRTYTFPRGKGTRRGHADFEILPNGSDGQLLWEENDGWNLYCLRVLQDSTLVDWQSSTASLSSDWQ